MLQEQYTELLSDCAFHTVYNLIYSTYIQTVYNIFDGLAGGPQYLHIGMENIHFHGIFNYEECFFFLHSSIDIIQKYSLFSDLRLCGYYPIQEKAHSVLQLENNVP